MPSTSTRILVVGGPLGMSTLLSGVASRGWESLVVKTADEARRLLRTSQFHIVFARETLPDGRGYDLRDSVARVSGTLLIGVTLSESCLWLPVLERGRNVFGKRALNGDSFDSELGAFLGGSLCDNVLPIAAHSAPASSRPGLHHSMSPRPKNRRRSPSR